MVDQSNLSDFGAAETSETDLYECEICRREFDSTKGRGIHRANSHGEEEIKQVLIAELQTLADKLGKPPGLRDMTQYGAHSSKTYQKKFGSWNDALKAADLGINKERDVAKSVLRDDLIRLADELNRTPTSRDVAKKGKYATSTYSNKFGTWNNAIQEAGLGLVRQRNITREELLLELERLTEELSHPPTAYDMREVGRFSVSTYSNEFGSWNSALQQAGISLNKCINIPESELLTDIRRLHNELNRVPTADTIREGGAHSVKTYERTFGSWNNALKEAGFEVNNRSNIPESELLDELQRLGDEIGRTPRATDMEKEGQFGSATYATAFGSWNHALQKAEFELNVRSDIPKSELIEDIQHLENKLGHTPGRREIDKYGQFDSTTCASTFGTWNNALREANLIPNEKRNIPKLELLSELQRLEKELGRRPIRDEMVQHGKFGHSVYTLRFGSWNDALIEAGFEPNKMLDPEHLDHVVRSTWELEIADLLLDAGVNYEYESLKIEYGESRIYTPDFVTDQYVIEVKGVIYGNEQKKAKAAISHLDDREYVVVGTKLPADIYIPWEEREKICRLFE